MDAITGISTFLHINILPLKASLIKLNYWYNSNFPKSNSYHNPCRNGWSVKLKTGAMRVNPTRDNWTAVFTYKTKIRKKENVLFLSSRLFYTAYSYIWFHWINSYTDSDTMCNPVWIYKLLSSFIVRFGIREEKQIMKIDKQAIKTYTNLLLEWRRYWEYLLIPLTGKWMR